MKNEEWKEYKLGDIYEVHNGLSKGRDFFGSGFPFLSFSTIFNNWFIPQELDNLVQSTETEQESFSIKAGDVFVTRTSETADELGMSCVALKDYPKATYNGFCKRMRQYNKSIDVYPRYVGYYLRNPNFRKEFQAFAGSMSTRASLTNEALLGLKIKLPSLATQKEIANILSALDDKIELNNAINRNLEEQAQAIFKNWFVDFEPFGGEMPKDWRVGKLSDIADITMGQSPDGKSYNENGDGVVFYQGRAEFGRRFPTRRLFTTAPSRMAKKHDALMSVRAPVGDLNIANEDCCIGRGLAAIHSKDNHQSFVHYTIGALKPKLDMYNGEGTVFGCINRDSLSNMEVIVPNKEAIKDFEQKVSILDAEIFNRSEENQKLISLRDSLLPKLMSGEIDTGKIADKVAKFLFV